MPKRQEQTNVLLDDQAKADARLIARHFGLNGTSAAIRFALREIARNVAPNVAAPPNSADVPQQDAE